MPTYGYHCPNCDAEFEVLQRMTDASGANCPRCGTAGRRLFFPTGIVFKGSGFYKTDSRRSATASVGGAAATGGAAASGDGKGPSGEKPGDKAGGERTPAEKKAKVGETTSTATKDSGTSTAGSTTSS